jgi:3-deoxy-D-manno-octulosonic-acid transferase
MQSEGDAERVRALGGRWLDPGRVAVLGNSKFDQEITPLTAAEVRELRADLHLPEEAPVFVAGSTRSPEEEAEVLAAYDQMRARFPDLCLVMAPRHIQRAEEVVTAAKAAGLAPVRRTQPMEIGTPARQIVLDTIGELAKVYAVADFAFVGNSFPPVVKGGGQNILQPLAHGKPVLFGPRTASIRSETALAIEAGVGFRVADGNALAAEGIRLLENLAERQAIAARALALIAANRGVSERYAEAVAELAKTVP